MFVENWYSIYSMLGGMWDVGMWNVGGVGCSGCGMLRMWVVWDVGCSGCEMFRMWDIRDVGCLGCEMWDVGCLPRFGMLIYKMLRTLKSNKGAVLKIHMKTPTYKIFQNSFLDRDSLDRNWEFSLVFDCVEISIIVSIFRLYISCR